ncbi:MAG TPA: collagen binding domain-containing protein, partial [Pseudogracilibacillus sp.]|nr:collagen binding domain-containing protein [Pseudogracilibacillus sp.]
MGKKTSLLLIFILLLQTVVTGAIPSYKTNANEQQNVFQEVRYIADDGAFVRAEDVEGDVIIEVAWSLDGREIQAGDVATIDISREIELVQTSGVLQAENNTIAAFEIDQHNSLRATFNESAEAHSSAKGEVRLEGTAPKTKDMEEETIIVEENESDPEENDSPVIKEEKQKDPVKQEQPNIRPFQLDGRKGFKLTTSEVKDGDKEYTEDNPLGIDDEFTVILEWELENNHEYQSGDTVTIELPKEIYIPQMLENELKDNESGEVIANYTVNTDGTVTLEFTDFVKNASNVKGWVKVFAKLDQDKVENDGGKVKISPIDDEGSITLPIDQSQIEKTTEKQGEPNRSYNADEIEWTVTINKNALFLEEATVTDLLPEGTEYIEGSLAIEKYPASLNGRPTGEREAVTGVTPELDGQSLSIPLGDINEVYVIKYKTKVTDLEKKHFNNKVSLTDKELKDTSAHATVTINRGEPLKKGIAENYDPKTGIITWYLEFNYDQKDLENITLEDNWTPEGKVELVDGSVSFQAVEIDENGKAHPVGEAIDPSELGNLKKEENGFKIEGITTDQPYKVTYQTKVIEREIEGFKLDNVASFENNEDGKGVHIGQYVGLKSAGQINYADKTIEWTIRVNMDERPM